MDFWNKCDPKIVFLKLNDRMNPFIFIKLGLRVLEITAYFETNETYFRKLVNMLRSLYCKTMNGYFILRIIGISNQ